MIAIFTVRRDFAAANDIFYSIHMKHRYLSFMHEYVFVTDIVLLLPNQEESYSSTRFGET